MVDVGVCQQQGVNGARWDWTSLPVARGKLTLLKQAAVDHDRRFVRLNAVSRSGYLAIGAEKMNLQVSFSWCLLRKLTNLSFLNAILN